MGRVIGVFFLALSLGSSAMAQGKKRVAVLNFDYATVQNYVSSIFGSNQDVGKGVAEMLVQKLVQGGDYIVVERSQIDKVLAEQNFSNSDRADSASAAKIGKILGVDAIIMGSITQFGRDDKKTGASGEALGRLAGHWGFGSGAVGKTSAKAVVGITARVVDTSTGQILADVTGKGESKRGGLLLGGFGANGGGAGGGSLDMGSSNFANTILGEATSQAVDSVAQQLDQSATSIPTRVIPISGLVADVSGNTLILDVGSKRGVQMGEDLNVARKVRDIRDPVSGKIIKTIVHTLGTVKITEVDALSATGTFTGSGTPKVGDTVSNAQ
jgi:curli biogenesis system outer membrane secretion channel CsgG